MGFQDLTDIHSRRHTQRVEHDFHRRPVGEERHLLFRHDPGNDALVAVASCHLVADRNLPLLCDVDLHKLDHTRRQFIRLEDLIDLLLGPLLHALNPATGLIDDAPEPLAGLLVLDFERRQVNSLEVDSVDHDLRELDALVHDRLDGPLLQHQRNCLPLQNGTELFVTRVLNALDLFTLHRAKVTDLHAVLFLQERIIDPTAEDLHVDDRPRHPGRHPEGRVFHVLRLLTEDRGEELLLRRQLRLALGRDFSDEGVPGLHTRTNADNAPFIEVDEALFRHVRDLARDLLHAALRVADVEFEFLDVDRRKDVVLHQLLADDDGILKVGTVPRHERHEQVPAECELALVRTRAVSDDIARVDGFTDLHQRTLVDGRVLVRPPVLPQTVAIILRQLGKRLFTAARGNRSRVDHDLISRDMDDSPAAASRDHGARVGGNLRL